MRQEPIQSPSATRFWLQADNSQVQVRYLLTYWTGATGGGFCLRFVSSCDFVLLKAGFATWSVSVTVERIK